jgi:hypothetical protein
MKNTYKYTFSPDQRGKQMKNEFVKRNLIIFQAAFENSILATVH